MLECVIYKQRPEFPIDVTLQIQTGTRLGLFGPSGAGKSTILSCIAGIENPDKGTIHFTNTRWFPPALPLHHRSLGYLHQRERLFPHLSVADNVVFALSAQQRKHARVWIDELIERLQLTRFWTTPTAALSGGQSRRVALARTLCRRPPLLLLDEPFAGLDQPLARLLIEPLIDWQIRFGWTLLVVDHDPQMLALLCPHAALLERGRITQQGAWTHRPLTTLPNTSFSLYPEPADPRITHGD